ncbi:DNA-directed RNA polymerase subunit beta' [bacterium]|nr:MAG: DNA-directed RNA polymerase subunit beta' [bacterium]
MKETIQDFEAIKLKIASPEKILEWSFGEVTKPETINYRTHRPERDGLFCERIFGPEKDYECYCGKYKKIRYKGIVCDKCGVEVTTSSVRRERMGHIKLACPVSHIWFLRGVPSKISLFLNISIKDLERVIYFTSYVIISVDDQARQEVLKNIDNEFKTKKKALKKQKLTTKNKNKELKKLELKRNKTREEIRRLAKGQVISEIEYYGLSHKYAEVFEAGIGAEALRQMMEQIDLEKDRAYLKNKLEKVTGPQKKKILRQLDLIESFFLNKMRPEWMFWTILPIIPPDLRPMVQLDGGRFATSDVNDLYRRVINRNNRLKRLQELKAPEVILRNEKRMLQEAVDALIDNSARKGKEVRTASAQSRALKSLADMLKGKQGRFRQNLLGKRVDYSGRSVIIVGPSLKLDECGLPKKMALEIFKPFIIHKLIYEKELAPNIKAASHFIEEGSDEVWDILEEVIKNKYILLNRAPTLHRLSIQAFKPILIEGNAIKLHPLVCQAFNADFDGDQMAVHLPISERAQKETEKIMKPSANLLKPATGHPIINPTQDIVLGIYWMTKIEEGLKGEGSVFSSPEEAYLAYDFDKINLKAKIKLFLPNSDELTETSLGRIILNNNLPEDEPFVNKTLNKKGLQKIIAGIIDRYENKEVGPIIDRIKHIGFHYATKSGISWGFDDLITPPEKKNILKEAVQKVEEINKHYQDGLLTEEERKTKVIDNWFTAIDRISRLVPQVLPKDGPIFHIFDSGARGSWGQTTQMSGIKGLVINPASEIIELPVLSNFKEGFNVLEYFISTHGARKGTTDTALKTAVAGYLTRRLVDVCQDIIIREVDCGDTEGITMQLKDSEDIGIGFETRLVGRTILEDIKNAGKIIAKEGDLIDKETAKKIADTGIDKIKIRSSLSCKAKHGLCQKCFGYDLGTNKLVEIGATVGIVAAQSIGEPGTQLTMRTFHAGGVAGEGDITQGLPRVEEILELRTPHERALISEVDGKVVDIEKIGKKREITIEINESILDSNPKKHKTKKDNKRFYSLPLNKRVFVNVGDLVTKGQRLSDGHLDLKALYRLRTKQDVQRYIIKEVQNIYFFQGAAIDERYIEVVTRKMFSRFRVIDGKSTKLLSGQIVERDILVEVNEGLKEKDKATATELLMGITKVSLSSESFLSAASFQETARVLINAACEGKIDKLRGLKENVIIGKLIPAGTGLKK